MTIKDLSPVLDMRLGFRFAKICTWRGKDYFVDMKIYELPLSGVVEKIGPDERGLPTVFFREDA